MHRPYHQILVVAFLFSTRITQGESAAPTAAKVSIDDPDDYEVHIPLSSIPLGVNLGPSLEVLGFVKDAKTGELPWIARRGWLEIGDRLVSVASPDDRHLSELNPRDFANTMQRVLESLKEKHAQRWQGGDDDADEELLTLRVRPGKRPGRASRMQGMYSPMTKEEVAQEQARWYLSYSTGSLHAGNVNVTLAAFGSEPTNCDALPVVMALPEDGCQPLRNAHQVKGAHVLVRRGGCSFLAKAHIISDSGGRSLVVIDEGAGRFKMEAEKGKHVDIPVVMISKPDGTILQKIAASTSRATGKLMATLVVTPDCLPRSPAKHNLSLDSSVGGDWLSRRLPSSSPADGAIPVSARRRGIGSMDNIRPDAVEAMPATAGSSSGLQAAAPTVEGTTDKRLGVSPNMTNNTQSRAEPVGGGEAENDRGTSEDLLLDQNAQCRERSADHLRGGDLILRTGTGGDAVVSVEFLSTFVSGSLSIGQNHRTSSTESDHLVTDDSTTLMVAVLSCDADDHPTYEHEGSPWPTAAAAAAAAAAATTAATKLGRRDLLLLPPDTTCSVERQIRLGEELGAQVLVVIAKATDGDGDIISAVTSATADLFATDATDDDRTRSSSRGESTAVPSSPESVLKQAEKGDGENPRGDETEEELAPHGDGDGERSNNRPQRRRRTEKGEVGNSARRGVGDGVACPPLTVVVGHEEGVRVLDWVSEGERGGGMVVASLVERDDVGKLWRDVVWASDPVNWPKDRKQRRRVLNFLRKTHSPKHAARGRGDGENRAGASATRWDLIERYYASTVAVEEEGGSRAAATSSNNRGFQAEL